MCYFTEILTYALYEASVRDAMSCMCETRPFGLQLAKTVVSGRKEGNVLFNDTLNTFYLQLYGRERERNVLFNDALNTFYLRLYGVRHIVKDHSDSERENPLPPHRLLFPISSKGSFICTIPQTG